MATLGERLVELQQLVDEQAPVEVNAERQELMSSKASLSSWFKGLNDQVQPEADSTDEPIADHMVGGLDQLKESIQDILNDARDEVEVIVCCLLNSILLLTYGSITVRHTGEASARATRVEDLPEFQIRYEEQYAITVKKYKKWLLFFRRMLAMIRRHATTRRGGEAGGSSEVLLVELDLAYLITLTLKLALTGPYVAGLYVLEATINYVGALIYNVLTQTRCAPLVDLWTTIVQWLFREPFGFIQRGKSYLRATLTDLRRQGRNASRGIDGNAQVNFAPIDIRLVRQLIDIIDRLIDALDVLIACPPPQLPSGDTVLFDPGDDNPNDNPGDPSTPDNPTTPDDPANPDPDPDNPRTPDNPDGPPGRGGGRPSSEGRSPGGGAPFAPVRQPGGGYGPPRDPDAPGTGADNPGAEPGTGENGLPSGVQPTDYIYLTPDNIARVLVESFDIDPARAQDVAQNTTCREDLTPDAQRALEQLGIQL